MLVFSKKEEEGKEEMSRKLAVKLLPYLERMRGFVMDVSTMEIPESFGEEVM